MNVTRNYHCCRISESKKGGKTHDRREGFLPFLAVCVKNQTAVFGFVSRSCCFSFDTAPLLTTDTAQTTRVFAALNADPPKVRGYTPITMRPLLMLRVFIPFPPRLKTKGPWSKCEVHTCPFYCAPQRARSACQPESRVAVAFLHAFSLDRWINFQRTFRGNAFQRPLFPRVCHVRFHGFFFFLFFLGVAFWPSLIFPVQLRKIHPRRIVQWITQFRPRTEKIYLEDRI